MKKIITAVLFILLMVFAMSFTAFADNDCSLVIGSVVAEGDTVQVPVFITAIPDGLDNIMSMDLKYSYDKSVLKYNSLINGTVSSPGCSVAKSDGKVNWIDNTDLSSANAIIMPGNVGSDKPFFVLVFDVVSRPSEGTEIAITSAKLSGGKMVSENTFSIIKASEDSYKNVNGKVSFPSLYTLTEKENAYGLNAKALVIDMNTDGVPYVDGVAALMVARGKFAFVTAAENPVITVAKDETAELVKIGYLHREDRVTAFDALIALGIGTGNVYDAFAEDYNMYIKADADLDFSVTATDALAINKLSLNMNVSLVEID